MTELKRGTQIEFPWIKGLERGTPLDEGTPSEQSTPDECPSIEGWIDAWAEGRPYTPPTPRILTPEPPTERILDPGRAAQILAVARDSFTNAPEGSAAWLEAASVIRWLEGSGQ